MDQTASHQQRKSDIDKSAKMLKLLEDDLFQELIVQDFIKGGVQEQSLLQNLDNAKTIDELKARQILHNHIFGIITSGEIANSH